MLNRVLKSAHIKSQQLRLPIRSFSALLAGRLGGHTESSLLRRRALGVLLLGGTSASIAAYQLRGYRRIQLDADPLRDNKRESRWLKASTLAPDLDANLDVSRVSKSETFFPVRSSGFRRFDLAQLASNDPIEDYHSELFISNASPTSSSATSPSHSWSFFTVLDGHAGPQTASHLATHLLPSVSTALRSLPLSSIYSSSSQDKAIIDTFLALDSAMVNDPINSLFDEKKNLGAFEAVKLLDLANAGACAIMAFFDSHSRQLKVANTGDCRAILGRRIPNPNNPTRPTYKIELLSYDHNGLNAREKERLTALHPDEPSLFSDSGRLIGWGPSRAFGDGRTKWSLEIQEKLKARFLGRTVSKLCVTPPYFTAEPEVTTVTVSEGDFLIMASDGLWECLTNEEAVGLVGSWISKQENPIPVTRQGGDVLGSLPVEESKGDDKFENPLRYKQWGREKKFVCVDGDSPAQHLIRNALGGADEDLRRALLALPPSVSRSFRDDITVSVVQF